MRVLIEVERDEEGDDWVVSGAEFTPLVVTFGTGATVPAALRDFAEVIQIYADTVHDYALKGDVNDAKTWEALEPLVTERG